MIVRGLIGTGVVLAATAATMVSTVTATAEVQARPRGQVVNCSSSPGWGRRDEFTSRQNLIVGPFALEHARPVLAYAPHVGGNKIFVYVRGGHRVTVELAVPKGEVGFVFGQGEGLPKRGVVSFVACQQGERAPGRFDGWPVTSWVGFLVAASPRCIPLRLWVDNEPTPRRALLRFGVRQCDGSGPPPEPIDEQPTTCSADEVKTLTEGFVDAFNDGDLQALDGIFAHEPDFEWYSTDAPGERLTPLANDRPSLVPYFRDRFAHGEQLVLRSLTFNGNTTGRRPYGNFVYTLTRSADDLVPTAYSGKGAALCYRNRPDVLFVWLMVRETG